MAPTAIQLIGAVLFAVAVLHTFATKFFEQLAHRRPAHAGLWHLLGEVEVVFGFWAIVLVHRDGRRRRRGGGGRTMSTSRNFTEPMFVFAIMVMAASRPILQAAVRLRRAAGAGGCRWPAARRSTSLALALVPLLGSLITEPAAMTLAALMLSRAHLPPPASRSG